MIMACVDHSTVSNQTFLVSDGEDMSTMDFLQRLAHAMGRQPNLLPVSETLLRVGAKLLGKQNLAQSLLENMQVDMTSTCQALGWLPPIGVDEGLRWEIGRASCGERVCQCV